MPIAARNHTNQRKSAATNVLTPNEERIVGSKEEDDLLVASAATLRFGIKDSHGKYDEAMKIYIIARSPRCKKSRILFC